MSENEIPDRTIHVKDPADEAEEAATSRPDPAHEAGEDADAQDPSLGGSSDGDTSA
jgi:hypothetical protein